MISPSVYLEMAQRAALQAQWSLAEMSSIEQVQFKGSDRDIVTEWDFKLEKVIKESLAASTPDIPIVAEESDDGQRLPTAWLVDPIDGTVNFSHGLPLFGISIALMWENELLAACVIAPALDWVFTASRGGGAEFNGTPMAVSKVTSVRGAMLATGFPYDRETNKKNNLDQWDYFQRTAQACRRLGAASLDLCFVAQGWIDGYWERGLRAWDMAAGALIITEAGGTVTSPSGGRFEPYDGEAVASNGLIHAELLQELKAADAYAHSQP